MSTNSAIEWTDATWNPVRGCTKVSPGCANCYAETFAERFRGVSGHPYEQGFDLRLVPEKLAEPLRWKKPRRIFVNSMSDLFQDGVPDSYIDQVFAVMALCPQHTFQVLTKRAERMRDYMANTKGADGVICRVNAAGRDIPKGSWWRGAHSSWPWSNVWLGVSVENQHFADERIPLLLQTPAAVRFISAEPLLGAVDLTAVCYRDEDCDCRWDALSGDHWIENSHSAAAFTNSDDGNTRLDWVIVGGESGHSSRPLDLAWAFSIVEQCRAAGVAVFVKQLGSVPMELEATWRARPMTRLLNARNSRRVPDGLVPLKLYSRKGGNPAEWEEGLRVREFPTEHA